MLSQGNSMTTAHIYLCNLRTIFNEIINDGLLSKHYPFNGFKMGSCVRSKAVVNSFIRAHYSEQSPHLKLLCTILIVGFESLCIFILLAYSGCFISVLIIREISSLETQFKVGG